MILQETLSRAFLSSHPPEATRVLERFSPAEMAPFFENIPSEAARKIIFEMGEPYARLCLELMDPPKAASLFSLLTREHAAALIRGMDPKKREPLLAELPPDASLSIRSLLRFPRDTAGAVMDSRVLSFPEDLPVHQALQRIRQNPGLMTHYAYVVDRRGLLVGVTTLTELMLAPPRRILRSVMKAPVERLSVLDIGTYIIRHPAWKRFHKLPVVDRSGKFLGVVRYKTLRGLEGKEFESGEEDGFSPFILMVSQFMWTGLGLTVYALAALLRSVGRKTEKGNGESP